MKEDSDDTDFPIAGSFLQYPNDGSSRNLLEDEIWQRNVWLWSVQVRVESLRAASMEVHHGKPLVPGSAWERTTFQLC